MTFAPRHDNAAPRWIFAMDHVFGGFSWKSHMVSESPLVSIMTRLIFAWLTIFEEGGVLREPSSMIAAGCSSTWISLPSMSILTLNLGSSPAIVPRPTIIAVWAFLKP